MVAVTRENIGTEHLSLAEDIWIHIQQVNFGLKVYNTDVNNNRNARQAMALVSRLLVNSKHINIVVSTKRYKQNT